MTATLVYIQVKAEFLTEFKAATKKNHENSVREKGNIRFDILQDPLDPCKFVFYEAYETEEAALRHKETGIIPHGATAWRTGWPSHGRVSNI